MTSNDENNNIDINIEEDDEEWDTLYNEDYKEKQVDENGREYLYYLTYGGGPSGGYIVYTDNNTIYSWHYEYGYDKRRLTLLNNPCKLVMRRNPDMPSNIDYACCFQVKCC